MSATSILIVDHEPRPLRAALIARGFQVSSARSGEEALESLEAEIPNVILLDSAMPGMSGVETCVEIRSRSDVPIIFLSSCGLESRKVEALESGADDCVVKPFGMDELVARIHALLRRTGALRRRVIMLGNVEVDLESHEVKRSDALQHLTAKEFQLFHCLVSHAGAIVSHRRLLQAVWGPDYGDELGYLRVFVNQLRKKVEPNPSRPEYIVTEPYEGYRFVARPELEGRRSPDVPCTIAHHPAGHRMPPGRSNGTRGNLGKVITLP